MARPPAIAVSFAAVTLVLVGLAWVTGLVAVGAFESPWWMGAAWVAAASPAVAVAFSIRRAWLLAGVCILAASIAGARLAHADSPTPPSWVEAVGSQVELTATVESEPDRGNTTTGYVLGVESLAADQTGTESGGNVLVFFNQYANYLPGDRITISGKLEAPPSFDGFDYRAYLARRGISATMFRPKVLEFSEGAGSLQRWLTSARLGLDRSLQRSLPEPEASLAAGIAYGRDDGLSRESKDEYNRAGLRHLVAVSGSNVILVVALTYFLAIRSIGRRWAWIPAAFTLACYLCAAGLSPSVLRSGVMAGVLLGGSAIGRPQSGLPALSAAVIAMTAISPGLALDAGFQLSATATAGLITLSPWVTHWLLAGTAKIHVPAPVWLCEVTALTLAASVSTAPIMWVTFGEISLVSPFANVLVEPVFVLAFWGSIATSVLGLVSRDLGEIAGIFGYYPLAFIREAAQTFGRPSWAAIETPGTAAVPAVAASAVLAALGLIAYRYQPQGHEESPVLRTRRAMSTRLLLAGSLGATALAFVPITLLPRSGPGELVVEFLDVAQGDSALVITPHGHQVLIDGGASGLGVVRELGEVMPHWDRSIDMVIASHPQEDHIGGLPEVLARMRVATTGDNGEDASLLTFGVFVDRSVHRSPLVQGEHFEVDGVHFEVLWPLTNAPVENPNDASLVIRVTFGSTSFFFTGDAEGPVFEALAGQASLHADVLKVPHHGSKTTPSWVFDEVNPAVAVISVGAGNPYGHPHANTLAALGDTPVYRTDVSGRVEVRSDGKRLTVSTER